MQVESPVSAAAAWLAVAAVVMTAGLPARADCPPLVKEVARIIVVTTPDMRSVAATLRRFERPIDGGGWQEIGTPAPAVVGATGLGWGVAGEAMGEPHKQEGDRRTPAGLFRLGVPFGRMASSLPGYVRLVPERQICVDDPASPRYGRIVSRAEDPAVHGEDMGRVSLYRRGFMIDYPIDASRRGGSCIFLHVWRSPTRGTVGCVAAAEPTVATLQGWAKPGDVIAILPVPQAAPLLACLKTAAAP